MKVAFKNTIFWCWIWALIHANHFYNLELIEFKAYIAPTCISIPLSHLGSFFQKKSITFNLGQNCSDKIENRKKWPESTLILGRKGENLEFEKLSHFLNLLDFQLLSQQVLSRVVGLFQHLWRHRLDNK